MAQSASNQLPLAIDQFWPRATTLPSLGVGDVDCIVSNCSTNQLQLAIDRLWPRTSASPSLRVGDVGCIVSNCSSRTHRDSINGVLEAKKFVSQAHSIGFTKLPIYKVWCNDCREATEESEHIVAANRVRGKMRKDSRK